MTGRVVAFRVGEETFPAIDAQRKKIGESWKEFALKSFVYRFEGTEMAKAIAAELKEVETKRGKKAKVEPAGDEVDVPEGV